MIEHAGISFRINCKVCKQFILSIHTAKDATKQKKLNSILAMLQELVGQLPPVDQFLYHQVQLVLTGSLEIKQDAIRAIGKPCPACNPHQRTRCNLDPVEEVAWEQCIHALVDIKLSGSLFPG